MINLSAKQKLNSKLFHIGVEQASMRQGFGEGLLEAGEADKRVVALTADLKESTKVDIFAGEFSKRFIEVGVAEQNLASVASGMAAMGKIPFIASYAIFSPGRNWEQIRTTICYNNVPVKIVGSHTGVTVGPDGGSHQALEDIAITRVLPNMTVVVPCDALEAAKATMEIAKRKGPAYLRLSREKTPIITTDHSPFKVGRANVLVEPREPEVTIIACGPSVYQALRAAKHLAEKEKIQAAVINCHTIKPLDKETIAMWAKRSGAVVTAEDHQKAGGLGGAVAELLGEEAPVPLERVGVDDEFGQSGDAAELVEYYCLDAKSIVSAAKRVIIRKQKRERVQSRSAEKFEA